MAEIKSTLDLVMARTRHLTFSETEKQANRLTAARKSVGGLMHQFSQGRLSVDQIQRRLAGLDDVSPQQADRLLRELCLEQIGIEDARTPVALELIESVGELDVTGLKQVLDEHRQSVEKMAGEHRHDLAQQLAERYRMSGSALVPNLEADPQWQRSKGELKRQFDRLLAEGKKALAPQGAD